MRSFGTIISSVTVGSDAVPCTGVAKGVMVCHVSKAWPETRLQRFPKAPIAPVVYLNLWLTQRTFVGSFGTIISSVTVGSDAVPCTGVAKGVMVCHVS